MSRLVVAAVETGRPGDKNFSVINETYAIEAFLTQSKCSFCSALNKILFKFFRSKLPRKSELNKKAHCLPVHNGIYT